MSHDNSFNGKKLYILLTSHNTYQKLKTESVYLIPNNNYGPFSETSIFPNFPLPQQQKMMTSSKEWRHFEFFLYEAKDNML